MVRKKIQSITRFDLFSTHIIPATIVFIMMMVLIGLSWRSATRVVTDTRNEEVLKRANFIESNIKERMSFYENTLRAAGGFVVGSQNVSRSEWKQFVDVLDLEARLPGILAFGYAEIIQPKDLPAYIDRVRAEGFPDFNINPDKPVRDLYTSITFVEPYNERNKLALGGDMYTEPNRRQAMENARDNGTGSMTNVVPVLQTEPVHKNGVLLYFPVYSKGKNPDTTKQRRRSIRGYVYAPLSSDKLFGHIFFEKDSNFTFQIFDSNNEEPSSVLYDHFPDQSSDSYYWVTDRTINISDRVWKVRYGVRNGIVAESLRQRPQSVAFGGTIFSLIVAAIVYLLLQRRTRIIRDKQERKIERAKDNLLSLASHQLRTPATGVKQYLGMVLEGFTGRLKKEQREILSRAYESNERQLRIINEFLYLARADANRVIISPQQFDLVHLTKQIVDDMQGDILEAGHTVRLAHKANKLMSFADVHSSRMIIENLLSNAIKYTPSGGRITISLKKQGNFNTVSIEDTGVGIAGRDFIKLFKQFSRIPNELTKQTTGSGIGLYLANFLTKANGGHIDVESDKGVGSIFTVYLPRKSVKKVTVQKAS